MSSRLVTIATFQDPVAAALARNYLASEGISACLMDEATVATDWLISNAVGGIKLQVEPIDVERAEMLLVQSRPNDDEEADDEPLTTTAVATADAAEEVRQENEDKALINVMADRLYRCAIFGLLFVPLQLYVLYLLVRLRQEDGHVSTNRRWKVRTAIVLNVPLMAIVVVPLLWAFDLLGAAPGSPENPVWRPILMANAGFSIRFPHEPRFERGNVTSQFGAVQMHSWTAWTHQRTFRVTIDRNVDFPANLSTEQVLQRAARDRLLGGEGVMREDAAIDFRGVPGREYWVTLADVDERGRVFVRGSDLIFVFTQGSPLDVKSAEAEQYLQSFRFR